MAAAKKNKRSFDFRAFAADLKQGQLEARKGNAKQMGLRELAKSIGTSPSTLSRIQNNKGADIDTIIKVCEWMQKDITHYIK